MATLYLTSNSKVDWMDPSEEVVIDDEVFHITELDKKDWAALFSPAVLRLQAAANRVFLLKVET